MSAPYTTMLKRAYSGGTRVDTISCHLEPAQSLREYAHQWANLPNNDHEISGSFFRGFTPENRALVTAARNWIKNKRIRPLDPQERLRIYKLAPPRSGPGPITPYKPVDLFSPAAVTTETVT